MDFDDFLDLPTEKIAALVQERGPRVCVVPLNGTRRWFLLEQNAPMDEHDAETFVTRVGEQVRRLGRLFFDHGVSTLLMPVFGTELATRGAAYRHMAEMGLLMLTDAAFHAFYAGSDARVRFYGNFRSYYNDAPDLLNAFSRTETATHHHKTHRLFYGVCAESATQIITHYAAEQGRALTQEEAIEVVYGERVPAADLFVGFDRPTAFDMPLVDDGNVALYFTVAPSPYLEARGLRAILYDWIFIRPGDGDYERLDDAEWQHLRSFYHANRHSVMGLGVRRQGIWYPAPGLREPQDG